MEVKIKLNGGKMPMKAHPSDAAFDLYAPEDIELKMGRQVIDLKFSIELPIGYAATIQPRSGFSCRGISGDLFLDGECFCSDNADADVIRGLVDANYRGNVGVIVYTREKWPENQKFIIPEGTRIAQMQIVEVPQVELIAVDELSESDRGVRGFGSTGIKERITRAYNRMLEISSVTES